MDIGTQTHLHALRDLLTYRQRELQAVLHAAGTAPADSAAAQVADARHRGEMARVERALQRLEAGVYGDCLQCGRPIPLQRLLVQPAVEHCAACQAVVDTALPE